MIIIKVERTLETAEKSFIADVSSDIELELLIEE